MNDLLRSFVRTLANVFHPRMLWLMVMPFVAATLGWGAILWFFWETLTSAAGTWTLTRWITSLSDTFGFSSLHAVIAPFLVVMTVPLIVVTLSLWLIPPFFALIPPLLWGWLTYRVMTYDALAHASADERRIIVREARW